MCVAKSSVMSSCSNHRFKLSLLTFRDSSPKGTFSDLLLPIRKIREEKRGMVRALLEIAVEYNYTVHVQESGENHANSILYPYARTFM